MLSESPATPRLSAGVVTGLWVLALLDLTFGAWLLAVAHDAASCTGLPCTVATLGDQPSWALVLSQISAVLLVALLPANQAAVGGVRLAGIAIAGIGGVVALAGIALLVAVVALGLVTAAAILVYVIDNL
jgi:hypothetical protein